MLLACRLAITGTLTPKPTVTVLSRQLRDLGRNLQRHNPIRIDVQSHIQE